MWRSTVPAFRLWLGRVSLPTTIHNTERRTNWGSSSSSSSSSSATMHSNMLELASPEWGGGEEERSLACQYAHVCVCVCLYGVWGLGGASSSFLLLVCLYCMPPPLFLSLSLPLSSCPACFVVANWIMMTLQRERESGGEILPISPMLVWHTFGS